MPREKPREKDKGRHVKTINQIKGQEMKSLCNMLPVREDNKKGEFYVVDTTNPTEENQCTKKDVEVANKHNWQVYDYKNKENNGKNLYVAEVDDSIFVLDVGLKYPENEQLGVDYVVPNMDYLFENKKRIAGVFLTHGHADAADLFGQGFDLQLDFFAYHAGHEPFEGGGADAVKHGERQGEGNAVQRGGRLGRG